MSSKENHIINPGNYEEFFILYMDNELTAAERKMVEEFLAMHPGLRAEMDLLMSTQLTPEVIRFDGKAELLASQMKLEAIDDQLLLYIDNELGSAEKSSLEKELKNTPAYQEAYQLLIKTKLDPSEKIEYPNKKELYRHNKKVIPLQWAFRVAAVVLLVLFASVLWLNQDKPAGPAAVADNRPKATPPALDKTNKPTTAKEIPAIAADNKVIPNKTKPAIFNNTVQAVEKTIAMAEDPAPKDVIVYPIASENPTATASVNVPENAGTPVVTNDVAVALNKTEEPSQSALADGADGKGKGSFKGFLRKATRMIERTTGIVATNDENQLLIGALAVKLK